MLTERGMLDPPTTSSPPSHADRFQLSILPDCQALVGPVVILQKGRAFAKPTVLISYKLIGNDGTETVIGCECRGLWQGADGAAFDVAPGAYWRIAAVSKNGIVTRSDGILRH